MSVKRMICKKCGAIFTPETYREKITGTCSKEKCWVPSSDTENIEYLKEDQFKYKFNCLKCNEIIYTDNPATRLCRNCRQKNKRIFIGPYTKK